MVDTPLCYSGVQHIAYLGLSAPTASSFWLALSLESPSLLQCFTINLLLNLF